MSHPCLMPFSGFLLPETPFPGSWVPVPSDAHFLLYSLVLLQTVTWPSFKSSDTPYSLAPLGSCSFDLSARKALSPSLHGHGWLFPILQVPAFSERHPHSILLHHSILYNIFHHTGKNIYIVSWSRARNMSVLFITVSIAFSTRNNCRCSITMCWISE